MHFSWPLVSTTPCSRRGRNFAGRKSRNLSSRRGVKVPKKLLTSRLTPLLLTQWPSPDRPPCAARRSISPHRTPLLTTQNPNLGVFCLVSPRCVESTDRPSGLKGHTKRPPVRGGHGGGGAMWGVSPEKASE